MKNKFQLILSLAGALACIGFLVWAFSLHGTVGLFRVNGTFRLDFIAVGILGLAMLALGGAYEALKSRLKHQAARWMSVLIVILSLPAIITPSAAFVLTSGIFAGAIGDIPPQIIIADTTGASGIADLAVCFSSAAATRNTLVWGPEGTNTPATLNEAKALKQHAFLLRDLVPGRRYTYRLNNADAATFSAPSANGRLHFAVGSDAHEGAAESSNTATEQMLQQIADPDNKYDLFFFLGDLVEYGFERGQYHKALNAFSAAGATIPVRLLPGNHDTLFSGLQNYESYCAPDTLSAPDPSRLWSRIDIGKVHFLLLDLEWSTESYSAAQQAWLETQLESIPTGEWKIVMSHTFYYASGSVIDGWDWYDNPETISRLTPLFEKYNVDLVFSGHAHQLELLKHQGVTYAICGGFGGLPNQERTYSSPASEWYWSGAYAFVDVKIDAKACTLSFLSPEGKTLTSISVIKR